MSGSIGRTTAGSSRVTSASIPRGRREPLEGPRPRGNGGRKREASGARGEPGLHQRLFRPPPSRARPLPPGSEESRRPAGGRGERRRDGGPAQGRRPSAHPARGAHGDPGRSCIGRLRRRVRRRDPVRDHRRDRSRRSGQGRRLDARSPRGTREGRERGRQGTLASLRAGLLHFGNHRANRRKARSEIPMTGRGRSSLDGALDGSEVLEIARVTPPARVSGLMGPARSLVEAVLASFHEGHEGRRGPVVVVVPDERRLPPAVSDLTSFLHALGSDRKVLPFPAFALDPYRGLSPHLDVVAARLKALAGLLSREDVIVVASAPAVLYRTAEPSVLQSSTRTLRPKETVDPLELERFFVLGGYRYEDPVTTPGDFTRRGGVLDVVSSALGWAVRV